LQGNVTRWTGPMQRSAGDGLAMRCATCSAHARSCDSNERLRQAMAHDQALDQAHESNRRLSSGGKHDVHTGSIGGGRSRFLAEGNRCSGQVAPKRAGNGDLHYFIDASNRYDKVAPCLKLERREAMVRYFCTTRKNARMVSDGLLWIISLGLRVLIGMNEGL